MNRKNGFTVMELLVSISIIVFMSSLLFFNFPKFNQTTIISNAARDLSLALRDAQARAVAVSFSGGGVAYYGVYTTRDTTGGANKKIVLFNDLDDDKIYDDPGVVCSGECVKRITLPGGSFVESYTMPDGTTPLFLNTIYYRPDPSTKIRADGVEYSDNPPVGGSQSYGPFKIILRSQNGAETRKVEIWRTGQISIQ